MWDGVRDKIRRLRAVDRQLQSFGAHAHRYELRPRLGASDVAGVDARLGVALPEELRRFYLEVGNGVAGPDYGLEPAEKLSAYRPREPYPGVEALKRIAAAEGTVSTQHPGYFEVPHEALTGLLTVIHEGCGHETCLIVTGDGVGRVVRVNNDGCVTDTTNTLVDLYTEWLDGELEQFEAVRTLMLAGLTRTEINDAMQARYGAYNSNDRIVSIADVRKPEDLFGEGGRGTYHGAVQFPWYDRVLADWQRMYGIRR
jgi:hypothetical protein